ncbi:MAG: peptidoglycan DD-metalloendopeptidase family protein [Solirubrobacterales bacterium]
MSHACWQRGDDQAGGLYNYGARFYNPKWGRFVSADEMVQGFDSQGLNPFTYVLNRPINATDPTGSFLSEPPTIPPPPPAPSVATIAWPTESHVVIRPFGPDGHDGLDIRARRGTKIFAAADGDVIGVYSNPRGGGQVKIKHRDGSITGYAHLSPGVQRGQKVKAGDPIGKSDGSGKGTGPHLHFTFRASESSAKSDPMQMLGGQ